MWDGSMYRIGNGDNDLKIVSFTSPCSVCHQYYSKTGNGKILLKCACPYPEHEHEEES
jgi:hypothetical protein